MTGITEKTNDRQDYFLSAWEILSPYLIQMIDEWIRKWISRR
jgi:hypothetical protein